MYFSFFSCREKGTKKEQETILRPFYPTFKTHIPWLPMDDVEERKKQHKIATSRLNKWLSDKKVRSTGNAWFLIEHIRDHMRNDFEFANDQAIEDHLQTLFPGIMDNLNAVQRPTQIAPPAEIDEEAQDYDLD